MCVLCNSEDYVEVEVDYLVSPDFPHVPLHVLNGNDVFFWWLQGRTCQEKPYIIERVTMPPYIGTSVELFVAAWYVDEAVHEFNEYLIGCVTKNISKRKKPSTKFPFWFSRDLTQCLKSKSSAPRKYKRTNHQSD